MDEYLRSQRSPQIQGQSTTQLSIPQDANGPTTPRMPLTGMLQTGISSTPATPTGTRRTQPYPHQQFIQLANLPGNGRSLERQFNHLKHDSTDHSAFSDSEYARNSPHLQERGFWKKGSPSPSQSPILTKRDAVFGSRYFKTFHSVFIVFNPYQNL